MAILRRGAGNVMLFGGSRSGKTFVAVTKLIYDCSVLPRLRAAILRRQHKDVRQSVMMDTFPDVMQRVFQWSDAQITQRMNKADCFFKFDNGSEIWFAGLDDKGRADRILGRQFGLMYFNECSEFSWASIELAQTRLAQLVHPLYKPRALYDCNPPSKSHWSHRLFIEHLNPTDRTPLTNPDNYASLQMNPMDNADNLPSDYIESRIGVLKGRARQRFLLGQFTEDNENALWKRTTMIDPFRVIIPPDRPVELDQLVESMERIVIGVDPAVTSSEASDSTGIVVCGRRFDDRDGKTHYYVLDDRTVKASPHEWAKEVVRTFHRYRADMVVAEVNNGGDLVVENLRHVDQTIPVTAQHATRGKIIRAEPIATLYDQGLVHHVNELENLEMEMTCYTGAVSDESPNRMDALVWAMKSLSEGENNMEFDSMGSLI